MHFFLPLGLIAFIALGAMFFSTFDIFAQWALSPLVLAIAVGILIGNTIGKYIPKKWDGALLFSGKKLLRLGIILYGLRITVGEVFDIGLLGIMMAVGMLFSTFFLAVYCGQKFFGLDRETSVLVGAGSSICGAAAVLATESALGSKAEKSSLAVATVVVFGTLALFLVPFLFHSGVFSLSPSATGVYIGATVHEVAQVVGAGTLVGGGVEDSAVIVKMTRVILLVPFLVMVGVLFRREQKQKKAVKKGVFSFLPLFAVLFLAVIIFNSIFSLPESFRDAFLWFDTLLLTMAMFALGLGTNIQKFKKVGGRAFALAGVLFLWLIFGGYGVIKLSLWIL